MICKQCGENLAKQERFCPHCGSYFIAAEDETDGRMWKGVITANGTLQSDVVVHDKADGSVSKKPARGTGRKRAGYAVTTAQKVWGIIALASASLIFLFNAIEKFAPGSDTDVLGVLIFPLTVAAMIVGRKSKYAKFAWLPLIAAIVLLIN